VSRYDYVAVFWTRNLRPRIAGIFVNDLSAAERQRVGFNDGVIVMACVRDGPAWTANVLPGDVIVSLDDKPVRTSVMDRALTR
jgi:C-terminal processing protease CtpA/Prc